jgi:Protein of unknown function (DUF1566)
MKQLCASLTAIFFVLPLSATAGGVPWGEPNSTPGRFIVLSSYNDEAVFDSETGLHWERSPGSAEFTWTNANGACANRRVGNRKGWRLPTVQELASLMDGTQFGGLPASHPFSVEEEDTYWTATTSALNTGFAYIASFQLSGEVLTLIKNASRRIWCVRGGQGIDPQ